MTEHEHRLVSEFDDVVAELMAAVDGFRQADMRYEAVVAGLLHMAGMLLGMTNEPYAASRKRFEKWLRAGYKHGQEIHAQHPMPPESNA